MKRGPRLRSLAGTVGLALLTGVVPVGAAAAQEPPALPLSYSGSVKLSGGGQTRNPDSIFDLGEDSGELSLVTRRVDTVLRAVQPGRFSALFDAQYEDSDFDPDARGQVNQLYLSLDLSLAWKARFGKQRVLWGRGFSYIPTDFVNPPLDPSGLDLAKPGVTGASVDYISRAFSLTALAYSEDEDADSVGIKLGSSAFSGFDFDIVYNHAPSIGNALGGSFSADAGQVISPVLSSLVLFGGVAVHEKSRYPEIVRQSSGGSEFFLPGDADERGPYTSWLLGATYQFTDLISATAEIYHIGDAYSADDYGELLECLGDSVCGPRSASWLEQFSFGRNQRDYQAVSLNMFSVTKGRNRFTDTLAVDVGVLRNAGDDSHSYSLNFTSGYSDRAEITWRNLLAQGGEATEFGSGPYDWYTELGIKIAF